MKIQVYCAVSLDGFIAGVDDDLTWLGEPDPTVVGDAGTVGYAEFMDQTGAMLMGRRTFDTVMGFGDWPYGSTPVLVATTRPLPDNAPATVVPETGNIQELCEKARHLANGKNVYLDGGGIITQALDADCVDEMTLTVVPVLLGQGVRLYQGTTLRRFNAEFLGRYGTMLQTKLTR